MNAPLFTKIEDIEMYGDVLADGFVEETLARQEQVQQNKRNTLHSLEKLQENCNALSEEMQGTGSAFRQQSINFNRLQNTCNEFAENMELLQRASKKLSESFAMTARTIRINLNR